MDGGSNSRGGESLTGSSGESLDGLLHKLLLHHRAGDGNFNWASNLNFDSVWHRYVLFNRDIDDLFYRNRDGTFNGDRAFPLDRVRHRNLLGYGNLYNTFNSLDDIVWNRYLSDDFLVLRNLDFNLSDNFIRNIDLVRNRDSDLNGVRDSDSDLNGVRDVTRNLDFIRSGDRDGDIDVSSSLDGVGDLYLNFDLHWDGNVNGDLDSDGDVDLYLNRSRGDIDNSFNGVRDINKNLDLSGNRDGVRSGDRDVNVVVDFDVVGNLYLDLYGNGNINGNLHFVRNLHLNFVRDDNLIRNLHSNFDGNLNFIGNRDLHLNGDLYGDRNLDGDFDGVRTRDRDLDIIRDRHINGVSDFALALHSLDLDNGDLLVTRDLDVLDLFDGNVDVDLSFNNLFLVNRDVLLNNLFDRHGNRDGNIVRNRDLHIIGDGHRHLLVYISVLVLVHWLRLHDATESGLRKSGLSESGLSESGLTDTRIDTTSSKHTRLGC